MPLNINTLQTAIKQAFEKAKNTPPPADPNQADQVQDEILTQLAQDLATAVNNFIRSGDVVGITTAVVLDIPNETGVGTQTGVGRVQ